LIALNQICDSLDDLNFDFQDFPIRQQGAYFVDMQLLHLGIVKIDNKEKSWHLSDLNCNNAN